MSFEILSKGSILYIEAKDLLSMSVSGDPTFTYPGAAENWTSTAGGQKYNSTVADRNNLHPDNKNLLIWRRVSEHNRSQFDERTIRIEQNQRMANGLLRKYHVASKKQWDVSWNMLPSYRNETVDGGWGAEDLKTFYESEDGTKPFKIKINTSHNPSSLEPPGAVLLGSLGNVPLPVVYEVVFTSCDFTVVKRGLQPYWNVKLSLEQV